MAFGKKTPTPPAPVKRAIVASAMRFDFGGAQTWKVPEGDRRWQAEAWYHYDICGELRYATGWKGNAMAQATLYAADVDPFTGRPTGPTDNPTVQKITDSILGGPVKRPQHIRTMAINLDMVGEVYVFVLAGRGQDASTAPDEWVVVSSTEVKNQGGKIEFSHPRTGATVQLGAGDVVIRLYTPHPRLQLAADSAVRALLPTLREIERTSQNIAARLDSRLAGPGLLRISDSIDFPRGDDDPPGPEGFMELIAKSMKASLQDPGSAASQVPITFEAPDDATIEHITFETPLNKEVVSLRESAIGRLAAGLDLPREVVEGMGESNHWSAWQVEEATYKTHLLPLLDLISDALTTAYLIPALEAQRVPTPEQYMLAFDGSALIGQPDPLEQTLELRDRGLITDDAARQILNVPPEFAPQGEERLRAIATQLVTAAPSLFAVPELARALGFTGAAVPAQAAPAELPAGDDVPVDGPPSRTAAASPGFDAASLAVTYALERAGNRICNTQRLRQEFADVPRCEIHVRVRPDERHGDLLEGAWRHTPLLAEQYGLDQYARALLATGAPHTDSNLREWLERRRG